MLFNYIIFMPVHFHASLHSFTLELFLCAFCVRQRADERRKDSGGGASSAACLAEARRNDGVAGGAVRGLGVGET